MKNSNYTIGNRTRDLPACSAVPQPNAPPRAPRCTKEHCLISVACAVDKMTIEQWEMILTRQSHSRREPVPLPPYSVELSRGLAWERNRAAEVTS